MRVVTISVHIIEACKDDNESYMLLLEVFVNHDIPLQGAEVTAITSKIEVIRIRY